MNKIFIFLLVIVLLCIYLLNNVRMGVALTEIIVSILFIGGLICYLIRPKKVKEAQQDLGKAAGHVVCTIKEELGEAVQRLEESKREEERKRVEKKNDEIKEKIENKS